LREAGAKRAPLPGTLRVLLVEDSENDAMLLLRELRRGGYQPLSQRVCTPEDMEKALRAADARDEPFQVVISDYYMPRFRAPDALKLLRELGHDVPFIVVSGKIGEDAAVGIMKAGANDYLTKENMSRLCPAIEREVREAEVRRERARAEKELGRSEDRFRRLVEQAADAIFVHDLEGNFVDVNCQACESLGYSREELLSLSVADVEVNYAPGSLRKLWKQITSGPPRTLEGIHRRKDGTTFPVEVRVGVFEAEERPLMLALIRDVSGRREVERRIRETEARYRTLVEQIPAVTYVQEPIDSENPKAITYMSPQYEDLLGYPAESEILDEEHWLRTLHPEDRERVLAEELRTDETGEPFRIEYRLIARDGRVVWVRDEATLLRDEEGNSLYWLGVQYDITEQKRAEEEFRRSEERFRATFEQAAVGIVQVGPGGEWLRFNDKFCDIVGYEREELGAISVFELVSPEDYERDFERGVRMLAGELRDYTEEKLIVGKGGRRVWINLTVSLVHDDADEPRYFIAVVEDIGRRKRAEEERQRTQEQLRQSEERFKLLAQEVVEGIILSENGKIIDANRSVTEMFGYDLGELIGKDAIELTQPEYREIVRQRISDEDTRPYESRGLKRDGTTFPIEIRPRHLPYSGRRIRVTSVIDLTERKQAEEALIMSEERYRTLVEQLPAVTYMQEIENSTLAYVSPQIEGVLGYSPEEYLANPDLRSLTIHPEDRGWVLEEDARTDETGEPYSVEYRRISRDGLVVWVREEAVLVRDSEDTPLFWQGILMDVTERKHQEEALRQSEALYRTVVEQAEENIFLVDAKSRRVLEANEALLRSLGYTDDELREMTLYDIVAHDQKSVDLNIGRIMEEGHLSLGERQYRRKDGSLADVEVNVSAVPYDGEKAMCIVAHDVTERKRAERMLEEIREAERNRLARELHDSTLQDIVYALQEVQVMQVVAGDDPSPALEDTAEALKRSLEGLRGAIFELRLKETLDRSLISSLENLVDLNRRMARGRYELELLIEDDFPTRLPDKTGRELTRLVQEALTNVRRHAEAGHVRVELGLDGGLAYVEVSDDGRGFDAQGAGTGMGRQSMRHRALELGGEFSVQSAPGEGTRVCFRIPVSRLVEG
jgi:PAS domain S-box-containing protein